MKNQRISAIIPAFNKPKLLLECIDALINQNRSLNAIFVMDNSSTDENVEALYKYHYISELSPRISDKPWETEHIIYSNTRKNPINIYYIRFYKNTGATGGFYEGLKRAYEKGYDWFWLMDDDSEPVRDTLEKLVKHIKLSEVIALSSLKMNKHKDILYNHTGFLNFKGRFFQFIKPINETDIRNREFLRIDLSSWTGLLINRKAIKKIGYPDKRFFIYYGDFEYCIRLNKVGKIYLIPNSVIIHKKPLEGVPQVIHKFLHIKTISRPYNIQWFFYYSTRNLIYLGKKYSPNKFHFLKELIKNYFAKLITIVLYDDFKYRRILFWTSIFLDGLKGKFNNQKPKKILYG